MIILVVSDTHRYHLSIEKVVKKLKGVDVLIHLGDNVQDVKEFEKYFKGPIFSVKGNCDFNTDVLLERMENIEGKRIFMTHGHRYDVKSDLSRLRYRGMEVEADIVLFGHTHISQIDYQDGIWFINPGSPALARDGFNSVAYIEINNGKINASIKSI